MLPANYMIQNDVIKYLKANGKSWAADRIRRSNPKPAKQAGKAVVNTGLVQIYVSPEFFCEMKSHVTSFISKTNKSNQ